MTPSVTTSPTLIEDFPIYNNFPRQSKFSSLAWRRSYQRMANRVKFCSNYGDPAFPRRPEHRIIRKECPRIREQVARRKMFEHPASRSERHRLKIEKSEKMEDPNNACRRWWKRTTHRRNWNLNGAHCRDESLSSAYWADWNLNGTCSRGRTIRADTYCLRRYSNRKVRPRHRFVGGLLNAKSKQGRINW